MPPLASPKPTRTAAPRGLRFALAGALAALVAAAPAAAPAAAQDAGKPTERRILGEVLEVRPGHLARVNRGAQDGVRERMVFDIYRPARVIGLPMSNEKAYIPEEVFAQLVVVSVEATGAVGRVVAVGGGIANVPAVSAGNLVASNPFTGTINIPPHIASIAADPPRTELGQVVTLKVECTDEPHDLVYYDWTATGGLLNHARSSLPTATWRPPVAKGKYKVTVTAVDTAGNRTQATVEIDSAGFTGIARNVYKPAERVLGKHGDLYVACLDLAFDESNTAWLIEGDDRRVVEMDGDWVKRGQSADASLKVQLDRAVAQGGHLYAIDLYNVQVVKLRLGAKVLQDKPIATYGAKGVGNGRLSKPIDIAVDAMGRVYVLDAASEQPAVHVFENDGTFVACLGVLGKERGQWTRPVGLAVSHQGKLFVLCDERKKVLVFENLLLTGEWAAGTGTDQLADIKIDRFSGRVSVLDAKSGQVRSFDQAGSPQGKPVGKSGEEVQFGVWYQPTRLKYDLNGSLYLLSNGGKVIHRIDADKGAEVGRWGGVELQRTTAIAAAPNGHLALLLAGNYLVAVLDERGWIKTLVGGRGAGGGKFEEPVDVQVDAEGNIAVLDKDLCIVQVFRPDGSLLRSIGKKGDQARDLKSPIRLTVSPDRQWYAVLEDRAQWNVKVYDLAGTLKAAFPGADDYLEDALDLAMTNERVHVAVDGNVRYFDIRTALERGPLVDGDGQNQFRGGDDYSFPGIGAPKRVLVSNLSFLFVLKADAFVMVRNLPTSQDFAQIKAPGKLGDPQDVAVDDFDRAYVWDGDNAQVVVFER